MTEWQWNEEIFRIKGLALLQESPFIPPHSVIPRMTGLIGMKCKWLEWLLNEIPSIVIFIPLHLRKDGMMSEWRNDSGMRLFLEGEKKTGFWDARHSNIIQSFQHHSILMRASHIDWDRNELEWGGMTSEWFNLVLSPIRRQHRIKSFRPHFTSFHSHSSLIIDSLPWLRLEWAWMERNEVWMI